MRHYVRMMHWSTLRRGSRVERDAPLENPPDRVVKRRVGTDPAIEQALP